MVSFCEYLRESNSAGSKFEVLVSRSVKQWLRASGLNKKFEVRLHDECLSGRGEDYSDIMLVDVLDLQKFFIECKQNHKANIVTTQFDISSDFSLVPVEGKARDISYDSLSLQLALDLAATPEYNEFVEFLQMPFDILDGMCPADYYFKREEATDHLLKHAISRYNKLVDDGEVEADCKKFDESTIRETTRGMLLCGLCWRLFGSQRTWDICHLHDIPYFGKLVKHHYMNGKAIPAKYIQLEDDLFCMSVNDNPLGISCPELPDDILGQFDMKFTPRFGSGSMYITPRSKITLSIESDVSFVDRSRWPSVI